VYINHFKSMLSGLPFHCLSPPSATIVKTCTVLLLMLICSFVVHLSSLKRLLPVKQYAGDHAPPACRTVPR
jgi:hypothetical protein